MRTSRTVPDKIGDAMQAFNAYRDELTDEPLRTLRAYLLDAAQKASESGDARLYADLVRGTIDVQRINSANDRAALIAAVMTTQSGVSRPIIDGSEE